jgi:hypothetical protein
MGLAPAAGRAVSEQWVTKALLMVLGAIIGVAVQELWRYLRPPEELRLMRRLVTWMPNPSPHPLKAAQPYVDALLARYRRALLRAHLARAASFGVFIVALLLSNQQWMPPTGVGALLALALVSGVTALAFQQRAAGVMRAAERKTGGASRRG